MADKSALYAMKAIAKKKGNMRQYRALDRKIKRMEGKGGKKK